MSNKANVLVGFTGFILSMFVFWLGGTDFDSRGFLQAYFFSISVCVGLGCYSYMRIFR